MSTDMVIMLPLIIILIIIIQRFSKSAIPRCARGAVQNKNRIEKIKVTSLQ